MLKIRIKADLRCPEGHRLKNGNWRASCEPCCQMYQTITDATYALKELIADYERQYPAKEADNEQG